MLGVLHQQLEAFRLKFGRDPGPGDPVFFDPDSAVPAPMPDDYVERETAAAMTRAGISPEIIHAYRRTGLLVSRENYALLSPEERAEWASAIEEYRNRQEKDDQ